MEVDKHVEDTIRQHIDLLNPDTHHWDTSKNTRSKILDWLTGKRKNHCICEYHSVVQHHPSTRIGREQMFHVKEKHGAGYDIALFKGKTFKCKECGDKKYTSTKQQRNRTRFVTFEELGIKPR